MTCLPFINGIPFISHSKVAEGMLVLFKDGQAIWAGPIGAPIEDAVYDTIMLNPADLARLVQIIPK
jgi:hypothetical protein